MYCTKCGAPKVEGATSCPNCGQPYDTFAHPAPPAAGSYVPPPPGAVPPPIAPPPGAAIPNYLVQSIIVTLCCCLPLGIVAIVFAAQVNGKVAAGDIAGAMDASNKAKLFCWIGFGIGLVVICISMMIKGAAFLSALHNR